MGYLFVYKVSRHPGLQGLQRVVNLTTFGVVGRTYLISAGLIMLFSSCPLDLSLAH